MLIGMDHGNRLIKLVKSEPFTCGLAESEVRPYGTDVLSYKDKYYQLSDQRIPYHRDKTEDDRYFILTLFGIAKEIGVFQNRLTYTAKRPDNIWLSPASGGGKLKHAKKSRRQKHTEAGLSRSSLRLDCRLHTMAASGSRSSIIL